MCDGGTMNTDLTIHDLAYLRRLDRAFDEKSNYEAWLAAQNQVLQISAERWCREARRYERAFRIATGIAALLAAALVGGFVFMVLR